MTIDMGWPRSILLVGCGNMGGAMLAGWLRAGFDPARFTVVDPLLAEAPQGVELLRELPQGRVFDLMQLGVKPQALDGVAPALTALAGPDTVLLSILAGTELASLRARFPDCRGIVRVMPNLAAAIGKSPMGVAAQGLDQQGCDAMTALLAPLGTPEWVGEELFDAVTALGGSGPAFVYRFIDALAQGGAAVGLPADQALRLALATVEGASALAGAAGVDPAELARRVASPGGTTEAGLRVMDADGAILKLAEATLRAARDRGAEMAAAARAAKG
ncbi:MAG TPA: pyrroline-5-carboxylate reductase dimerization domain-containing protein [Novosphingobium sp.]|nr:pyrroline-5-carboxylate reductase dimerization domain-containing protein [Novosphingobium sp.]